MRTAGKDKKAFDKKMIDEHKTEVKKKRYFRKRLKKVNAKETFSYAPLHVPKGHKVLTFHGIYSKVIKEIK